MAICKQHGKEMHRVMVPCPDGRPGCAVAHSDLRCEDCLREQRLGLRFVSRNSGTKHLRLQVFDQQCQDWVDVPTIDEDKL